VGVITTKGLTKKFGELTAVDNLDLDIKEGEIFGLLGPNGAGKTTIISMLATLLDPTSGTATVANQDILKKPSKVREHIGIVFQDPSSDDILTGRENLYLHGLMYGVPRSIIPQRIDDAFDLIQLTGREDDLVKTYSGGMRRRLELARGLLHHPEVLFLDEPTLGLDPQTRKRIWEHIEKIVDTYTERKELDKYSYRASLAEIKENDYNLNIPRYVDTFEEEEPIDIEAVAEELKALETEIKQTDTTIAEFCKELNIKTPF